MNQRRGFFTSALAGLAGIAIMPFVAGKKADLPTIDMGKAPLGRGSRMDWRAAEAQLSRGSQLVINNMTAKPVAWTATYTHNGDTIALDLRDNSPMGDGFGCFEAHSIHRDIVT